MLISYYKLTPIKMLNIDGHDFLFSDILRIFDNFNSSGGKMHAFMDEFDDDIMNGHYTCKHVGEAVY